MGKEQVTKPTQQPVRDAAPTHDSSDRKASSDPVIRVDPSDLVQTVHLGANHQLRYRVDNLRAGSRVVWHHEASGGGRPRNVQTHAGTTSQITDFVSHPGDREIDASVEIDGRRESTPTTTLKTPHSLSSILGRWGQSERGRFPVAHTMQQSEDLVLHVKLASIDASVDEVTPRFSGGKLNLKESRKVGDKEFEVVLAPNSSVRPGKDKPDDASGKLTVVPRRADPQSASPTPVTIHVEVGATRANDFGSRPGTTNDAMSRVVELWRNVYGKRMEAIRDLTSQLSKKDAIPEPPLWERLLKGAALLALNAVTAGFGAGVVDKLKSLGEGPKEAVKVFIEGSSAGIIEGAVSRGMAEATNDPSARRTPGGTLLSPDIFFGMTQREALRDAMLDHLNRVNSSLTYDASRLDRENPGAGYRVAVAAHDAITDQYALAFEMQFAQSLQAWCTFSAQARLGTGDPNRGRAPGTELATQVDVKKILPGDRGRPASNLDKTPGVLRLELAEIAPGHLVVVRSFIDGFDNDAAVKKLSRKVIDLHIPMVARFNEPKDKLVPRGFVISRNENGAVLADSTGGLMQEMFGGRSDHEAAREIFEHQIAHQNLTPARG